MLGTWDYVIIAGIIAQIIGFIFLLSRFVEFIRNSLHALDFLVRISELKKIDKITEYDKLTKPAITPEIEKQVLRFWETWGIILVISGLIAQLIAVIMTKI